MKAEVVEKKEIAESTIMVVLKPEQRLSYTPGQYMVLSFIKPKYCDERGSTRIFSIISSPEERNVAFATRLSTSAFKRCLTELKKKDKLEIKLIGGKFGLPEPKRKIIMIAGGIGIAPFMSMLKTAWKKSPAYDITLFYSNRTLLSSAFIEVNRDIHR